MLTLNLNRSFIGRVHRRLAPIIKNKKSASYFTIALSLFSLSFFGLFAIRPTAITAVTLYKNVNDLRKLNLEYENKIGSLVRAQAEYEQIRNSLPVIQTAIPYTSSFHKLVSSLENFAARSGLVINQLQVDSVPVSKSTPTSQLQKYGFNLITIGDYPSFLSYLQHLLNWKRLVTIDSMDFAVEGSSGSATLRVAIKGNTYYEP